MKTFKIVLKHQKHSTRKEWLSLASKYTNRGQDTAGAKEHRSFNKPQFAWSAPKSAESHWLPFKFSFC